MENNFLQFFLTEEDKRKKAIFLFLAAILSITVSCKIYGRLMGTFDIIPITEYQRIVVDFFLSGRFIISSLILIVIYKFFYFGIDLFMYKWLAKKADKIYDTLKIMIKRDGFKEELIKDVNTNPFIKWFAVWAINTFKQLSYIEIVDGKIKPSINFYYVLDYFKKVNDINSDENIDINLAYYPIPITLQILLLFDTIVIHHFDISKCTIGFINFVTIIVLLCQLLKYLVNIFVDLKKHKILNILERIEKEAIKPDTDDIPISNTSTTSAQSPQ